MTRQDVVIGLILAALVGGIATVVNVRRPVEPQAPTHTDNATSHLRATYDALHFKPAIGKATDAQCLACHREVLDDRTRGESLAGLRAADAKAWYQQTSTYAGDQETFHRRHLVTPLAKRLMNLQCNTCHEGHDPRDEAPGTSASMPSRGDGAFALRKQVNPETTCLKCHGQMPAKEVMGLPSAWNESAKLFNNDCLTCHATIRTHRHQVTYLNADAIEAAAKAGQANGTGGDVCYGCHGGRAWYRIAYPYPRHEWPNMPEDTPAWARARATQSEPRFLFTSAAPSAHATP